MKELLYRSINNKLIDLVPRNCKEILDLGCGTGAFGHCIKEKQNVKFTGITFSQEEAEVASTHLDKVFTEDLNDFDPSSFGQFDCIVCSHVLEHLFRPDLLLKKLHQNLSPQGVLIVALPNVLFWKQRWQFVRGRFRYTQGGLMDETHYRFFDWYSAEQLLVDSGYDVMSRQAEGGLPLPGIRRLAPKLAARLDGVALLRAPNTFGWQAVFTAKSASK